MEKCKLCEVREADKKGSHIVPHYLLKRVENIEGKKGRDYELGFTLSAQGMKSHFGRAVNPEKLDEIYGELAEEDIQKNKHPLVVDNFFCSKCEQRFAILESEYSKTIDVVDDKTYESGVDIKLGLLFWTSIIWRLSINGKSGVKLTDKQEEQLRSFLNDCIPSNNIQELEHIDFSGHNNFSYKLIRCFNLEGNTSKFLFFHPLFSSPYLFFIDEYVLAFAINDDYKELEKAKLQLLSTTLLNAKVNSLSNSKETIEPFDRLDFTKIHEELIRLFKDEYLTGLNELLDLLHQKAGGKGKFMPPILKQKILDKLVYSEQKLGRKHTQEEIAKTAFEIMRKF